MHSERKQNNVRELDLANCVLLGDNFSALFGTIFFGKNSEN